MATRTATALRSTCLRLGRRQHGVVARFQLIDLGVSPNSIKYAVKAGFLFTVLRGVYSVGRPELSERGLWMACVLASGQDAVLAGPTAAIAWSFRDRPRSPVTVIRPGSEVKRERALLKAHGQNACATLETSRCRWLVPEFVTRVQGIPILRLEPLLLQLAGRLDSEDFRYAFWEADRKKHLSDRRLDLCAELSVAMKGGAAFRESLDCRLPHIEETKSLLEVLMADLVRTGALPPPEINRDQCGHLVDFRWPSVWLAVETDGYEFHRGRGAFERDAERDNDLRAFGWTVLRFTYRMLKYRPEYVKETILNAHKSASRPGPWLASESAA